MYICVCKGINESQIRSAVSNGLCSRKDISRSLKAGTACGKCNPEIQEIVESCLPNLLARDSGLARPCQTANANDRLPLLQPFPVQETHLTASNAVRQ